MNFHKEMKKIMQPLNNHKFLFLVTNSDVTFVT